MLYQYDMEKGEIQQQFGSEDPEHPLPHPTIYHVYSDYSNRLWVGTRRGLALYNPEKGQFDTYRHQEGASGSLAYSSIRKIYDDQQGQVYFLEQSGIDFISPYAKPIEVLNLQTVDPTSPLLSDPLCTFRDSRGRLWMGTPKGLAFVDEEESGLLQEGMGTWESNYILDVQELPNGDLYFATSKGLARLPSAGYDQLSFEFFPFKNRQFEGEGAASFLITDLFYDGADHLWMTTNNGYSSFDLKTQQFRSAQDPGSRPLAQGNLMNKIIKDAKGNLWIGSRNDGIRFIPKGQAFNSKEMIVVRNEPTEGKSLSNDAISDIFEDRQGRIWVSTYYGLNRLESFDVTTDSSGNKQGVFEFTRYGKVLGWQTEVFSAIEQDEQGALWIGSLGGLYRFDPETSDIRHFVVPDGLPSDGIVTDGLELCQDGKLYVSLRGGSAWFHPDSISKSVAPSSKPVLTRFELFNSPVPTSVMAESNQVMALEEEIAYLDEIRLKHDQAVFTIAYTGLDVLNVSKQRYRYKLEGFEEDWVDAGYTNEVTYTNLNPGKYVFKVLSSNGDGAWSPMPRVLSIVVLPPWYQTWWAYLLFGLVLLGSIWTVMRRRMQIYRREMTIKMEAETKIHKARMEEREQMRQKNARDFHDETGVKLTRINLLTSAASQKAKDAAVKDCLKQIEMNTQDLTGSMRDFVWSLDPQKDSLASILQRLQDFGNQQFEYSNVAFRTNSSFMEWQDVELNFDTKLQVLLIFKEAMNNTLKYAEASYAELTCKETDDSIEICLEDDGKGFDVSMKTESYGLKNMQQRAKKMGGKCRVTSAPGSGTRVQLYLQETSFERK